MKPFQLFVCTCISLTGCTIGNGTICGFQTPIVECDKEAYQAALHPKPFVELWHQPGVTSERRLQDWVACGGGENGGLGFNTRAEMQVGEDYQSARQRLEANFYRCLIKHGYRYEGCDEGLFTGMPICGGQ